MSAFLNTIKDTMTPEPEPHSAPHWHRDSDWRRVWRDFSRQSLTVTRGHPPDSERPAGPRPMPPYPGPGASHATTMKVKQHGLRAPCQWGPAGPAATGGAAPKIE
jgi:hypothetical protein